MSMTKRVTYLLDNTVGRAAMLFVIWIGASEIAVRTMISPKDHMGRFVFSEICLVSFIPGIIVYACIALCFGKSIFKTPAIRIASTAVYPVIALPVIFILIHHVLI